MPWRSVSVMEEKEEFILHFKSGKYTVSALAQMLLSGKCNDPGSARELTHLNPSRL
jgi:hypothetical protein